MPRVIPVGVMKTYILTENIARYRKHLADVREGPSRLSQDQRSYMERLLASAEKDLKDLPGAAEVPRALL